MDFQPGDKVLYVPDLTAHGKDRDVKGQFLFVFHFLRDDPGMGAAKGKEADPNRVSEWLHHHGKAGKADQQRLHPDTFSHVVAVAPKSYWPGTVAVNIRNRKQRLLAALIGKGASSELLKDCGAAALDEMCRLLGVEVSPANPADDGLILNIPHPSGCWMLHYPVGACVKPDSNKSPHSFHKAEA